MLKGNETLLLIGGVRLASQRRLSINRQTDTIEVCSPVDGAAKRFVPSTTSWNVQAGGLYANKAGAERLKGIWRKYQNGDMTPLEVSIQTASGTETGEAILTDLQETGNLNELVQFSIQLQGSGVLTGEGVPMVFKLAARDMGIGHLPGGDFLVEDDDNELDYCEIVADSPFRLKFESVSTWAMVPGIHADWVDDIDHLDEHGLMKSAMVSYGYAGVLSAVIPSGRYVVYASNYESRIDGKILYE